MHVVSSLGFTMAGPDSLASASDLAGQNLRRVALRLTLNGAISGLAHEAIVFGLRPIFDRRPTPEGIGSRLQLLLLS
jgi:hypothetical protein